MHITAQGPRLRNDLYCVEWDVKLYYIILWSEQIQTLNIWYTTGISQVVANS